MFKISGKLTTGASFTMVNSATTAALALGAVERALESAETPLVIDVVRVERLAGGGALRISKPRERKAKDTTDQSKVDGPSAPAASRSRK